MNRLIRNASVLAVLLLVACGSGCFGGSTSSRPAIPPAFKVFLTPPESIPKEEERAIWKSISAFRPESPITLAHLVSTPYGGLWVFATSNLVCIAHRRGAACTPWGKAERRGVFLSVFRPPTRSQPQMHDFLVLGLVPNSVRRVIAVSGRTRVATAVRENVFTFAGDRPILLRRLKSN